MGISFFRGRIQPNPVDVKPERCPKLQGECFQIMVEVLESCCKPKAFSILEKEDGMREIWIHDDKERTWITIDEQTQTIEIGESIGETDP